VIDRCRRIKVEDIDGFIAALIDPRCHDHGPGVSPAGDDGADGHGRKR
jgi:hypothetical protein